MKMDEFPNPFRLWPEKGDFNDILQKTEELIASERLEKQKSAAQLEKVIRRDFADWLIINSLGIDPSNAIVHRYIQTDIFVGTSKEQSEENFEIATSFSELLDAAGFESIDPSIPEFGSMRWRRAHRTKSRKSAQQLDDRISLIQLLLTQSFRQVGVQVDEEPEDRAAMERAEALYKAELKEMEAETLKARAEAMKALSEAALNFAKAIAKAAVAFALVVGSLHVWGNPSVAEEKSKPTIELKVNSHKLGPNDPKEISGRIWLRLPEPHAVGIDGAEEEPGDPLE